MLVVSACFLVCLNIDSKNTCELGKTLNTLYSITTHGKYWFLKTGMFTNRKIDRQDTKSNWSISSKRQDRMGQQTLSRHVAIRLNKTVRLCTSGLQQHSQLLSTRKLCYRKDDHAMRPTYGCPENFWDSLTTSTTTIPNIFMGFCSGRQYERSYKIWNP